MILNLLFFVAIVHAKPVVLPFSDAVKVCDAGVRWGYFLQDFETIKKLGGRIDIWDVNKDLTGKFKSQAECESSKSKLKHPHLAEPCQMFSVGKETVSGRFFFAEAQEIRNLNQGAMTFDVLFKDKESCENALKDGGTFKREDLKSVTLSPKGSDAKRSFISECKEDIMKLCEKARTTANIENVN